MYYFDAANQLNLLIAICFSFCIMVFSLWFKDAKPVPRLAGLAFWAPLLMYCASFLAARSTSAQSFAAAAIPLLLLELSVIFILKPDKVQFGLFRAALLIFPIIALAVLNASPGARNLLSDKLNTVPPVLLLALLNLYLLKKEKGPASFLFWAVLPACAGTLSFLLPGEAGLGYLSPASMLAAYCLFMLYFYRVFVKDALSRLEDAERRLSETSRSIDYEVKKRVMEIERVNEKLVSISRTDPLSKALNKAAIMDYIEKMILTKPKSEFSVLMFDIDDFKMINDTLGHVTGDKCIKTLAILAKSNLRGFDVLGRYGGDEFIIVLPGADTHQAMLIAERFRKKVDGTASPHFSISIGVSTYPSDGSTVKQLLQVADDGLYKSKSKGKNAVSHAGSE